MDYSGRLKTFNPHPPANPAALVALGDRSGPKLPLDYLEFLQSANGGEGFIGETYVILWEAEELEDLNIQYGVSSLAPGLFIFGTNGGGEAFAFDLAASQESIVSVPFIPLDRGEMIPKGSTIKEFFELL